MLLTLLLSINLSIANQPFPNYYPCVSFQRLPLHITCFEQSSNDVMKVFRKNNPNDDIEILSISGPNIGNKITEVEFREILGLVAGSSNTLREIYLSNNYMTILRAGFINADNFPLLSTLHLANNGIDHIDAYAFQGSFYTFLILHIIDSIIDFVACWLVGQGIFLKSKSVWEVIGSLLWIKKCFCHSSSPCISTLERLCFIPVSLTSIFFNDQGNERINNVFFSGNIPCDCNLTWLVRDRPHLLPYLYEAQCFDWSKRQSVNIGDWNYQDSNCPNKSNTVQPIAWLLLVSLIAKLLCR